MGRRQILSMLAVVVVSVAGLAAQDPKNDDPNTRMVQGVVSDGGGKPVARAVVQLKDLKTLQIRSFYSMEDGAYHFAGLSTNVDYELRASHDGSESGAKTLSSFDGHKVATINLKLK
jgi:hypothetical protein